jgi:L-fuculose-phosphate aldolase
MIAPADPANYSLMLDLIVANNQIGFKKLEAHCDQMSLARSIGPMIEVNSSEGDLRKQLVRIGRWMNRLGFAPGTSGNLSARLDEGRILSTPTGCSKCLLHSSDMVVVDIDGKQLSGSRLVSSEIEMHRAIYRRRPDVTGVVHAHPPIATAFASSGIALDEPLCSEIVMTLGSVPLAPYATTGSAELGHSLAPYIADHDAILMANHGVVTYGVTLLDAFMKMETVEHFAMICLITRQLGGGKPLSREVMPELLDARRKYRQNLEKRPDLQREKKGLRSIAST